MRVERYTGFELAVAGNGWINSAEQRSLNSFPAFNSYAKGF
jgi:hypothetical protein